MLVRPRGPIGGNGPLDNPTTGNYQSGAVNLTQTTLIKDTAQKLSNQIAEQRTFVPSIANTANISYVPQTKAEALTIGVGFEETVTLDEVAGTGQKRWRKDEYNNFIDPAHTSDPAGSGFTVQIYEDNGAGFPDLAKPILPTDSLKPYFDYQTGVLFLESPTSRAWVTPPHIKVTKYIGRRLDQLTLRGTAQQDVSAGYAYKYLPESADPEQATMIFPAGSVYHNGYIWVCSFGYTLFGPQSTTKLMGWDAITKKPHPNSPIYLQPAANAKFTRGMAYDGKNIWAIAHASSAFGTLDPKAYLWKVNPDTAEQTFFDLTYHVENACIRAFQTWQYGSAGLNLNTDAASVSVSLSGGAPTVINMVGAGGGVDPVSADDAVTWINANKGLALFDARKTIDPATGEPHVMLIAVGSETSLSTTLLPGSYSMLDTWHGQRGNGFRGITFDPKNRNLWITNSTGPQNTAAHGRAVPFVFNVDSETCVSQIENVYCVYDNRNIRQVVACGDKIIADLNDGTELMIWDANLVKAVGTTSTLCPLHVPDLVYDGRYLFGGFFKYDPDSNTILNVNTDPITWAPQRYFRVIVTDSIVVVFQGWTNTYLVLRKSDLLQIGSGTQPFSNFNNNLYICDASYPSDGRAYWLHSNTSAGAIFDVWQMEFPIDPTVQEVQKAGTAVGVRPAINFTDGTNTTANVADDPTNNRVNLSVDSVIAVQQEGVGVGARPVMNFVPGENTTAVVTDNPGNNSSDVVFNAPPSNFVGIKYPGASPQLLVDPGSVVTALKLPFNEGPFLPNSRYIFPSDADTPIGTIFTSPLGYQYVSAPADGIVKDVGAGPDDRIVSCQGRTKFTSPPQMKLLAVGRNYYVAASNRDPTNIVRLIPNLIVADGGSLWSTSKRMIRIPTGDVWYLRTDDVPTFMADVSTDGGYTFPTSLSIVPTGHGGGTYVPLNFYFDSYYCIACLVTSGGRVILAGGQEYNVGSEYDGVRSIYSDDNGGTWEGHTYVIPIVSLLNTPLGIGDTAVVVDDSNIFPTTYPYDIRIGAGTAGEETRSVTNNNTGTNTLTISVGVANTHASDERVGVTLGIRAAELVEAGNGDILCVSYQSPTAAKIFVSRSTDNGYSWNYPPVEITSPGAVAVVRAIRCNNVTNDILVYWGSGTDIYFARSTDNGVTFSAPAAISTARGMDVSPFMYLHNDGIPATDGLYLFTRRIGSDQMLYRRSIDHGVTWSEPKWLSENLFGSASYIMDMVMLGTGGKVLGAFGNNSGEKIYGTIHSCMPRGQITDIVPSYSGYYRQQLGLSVDADALSVNPQEPTLVKAEILSPPYTGETIAPLGLTGDGTLGLSTDDKAGTAWDSSNPKTQYYELTRTAGGTDPECSIQFKYRLSDDLSREQQYSTCRSASGPAWQNERLFTSLKIRAGRSVANANNKVFVTMYDTKGVVNPAINNKELVFASSGAYEEFELTPDPNGVYNEDPFVAPVLGGSFEAGGEVVIRIRMTCDANSGTDYVRVSDITLDIG